MRKHERTHMNRPYPHCCFDIVQVYNLFTVADQTMKLSDMSGTITRDNYTSCNTLGNDLEVGTRLE